MAISYKEVKLPPNEAAYHFYWWLCEELRDGLNYGVSEELAHEHISSLVEEAERMGLVFTEPAPATYDCRGVADAMWELVQIIKEVT